MLNFLSIKNIVLIDNLKIDFSGGLCVLTGETGAGKSIILNSLNLVIGSRADYSLRPKNDQISEVIAIFSKIENFKIKNILDSIGGDNSEEIILKRQLLNDGKSRAFINDHLVTLSTLRDLGKELINIESQFSEQGLLDNSTHIDILDDFGDYLDLMIELEKSWNIWIENKKKLDEMKNSYEKLESEKERFLFNLDEINKLNPRLGEYEKLISYKKKYLNYTKISESLQKVLINFSNDEKGIEELISENIYLLDKISELVSPEIKKIIKNLDSVLIDFQEYKYKLETYLDDDKLSYDSIEEIEEKIYFYNRLSNKHNCKPEKLIEKREELLKLNNSNERIEDKIKQNELELKILFENYEKNYNEIHNKRTLNAKKLDNLINSELKDLKLENAQFETVVSVSENLSEKGKSKVLFTIKTNKSSNFDEIKKISSGGELCRFALALKVVSSKHNKSSIVFDEVDSGIGGAVASAVGERLKKLGKTRQIIVVTHSPQVASLGDEHFKVIKNFSKNENITYIEKLDEHNKVQEIARMLSGKEITNEAKLAASKLIENTN